MTQNAAVLIVDDDPDVRSFVVTVLEENGFKPDTAVDGVQGLELVQKNKPDLVILDVLMPRSSGIRLYRKLKTRKDLMTIPVIMLTGIALKSFLKSQKALDEFGDSPVPEPQIYLEKPVDPEDLATAVKLALAGQ